MRTAREPASFEHIDVAGNLCVWSAPDGAHSAELEPELVRELRYKAIQAFLAIPRRGLEIGGLLLGEVRKGWPTVFEITGLEEVPCEHRFGPAYTLDEPDRVALATIITRYPQDGAVQVVGFYRSYTGRAAEPDEADHELMRMFFRSREFVCLVLQPFSSESCMAGFRFWNDGEMRTQQNDAMFPFDAAQMEQQEVTAMPPVIVSTDKTIASADQAENVASETEPTPSKQGLPRLIPLVSPSSPAANVASATWPQPQELNDRPERPGRGAFYSPRFDDPQIAEEKESKAGGEEPNPRTTFLFRVAVMLLFIAVSVASATVDEVRVTEREARWADEHQDARQGAGGLLLSWDDGAPVSG